MGENFVQEKEGVGQPLEGQQLEVGDGGEAVRGKGKNQAGNEGGAAMVSPVQGQQVHTEGGQREGD